MQKKLRIHIPDRHDEKMWGINNFNPNGKSLTNLGYSQLRTAIRSGLKGKRYYYSFWLYLLIGLIGSISGVLVLLIQFFK